jgi:hypothetical protein
MGKIDGKIMLVTSGQVASARPRNFPSGVLGAGGEHEENAHNCYVRQPAPIDRPIRSLLTHLH